jgi:hypothetical protein
MRRILARVIPEITCKISNLMMARVRSHLAAAPDAVWTLICVESFARSPESKGV